MPAVTASSDGNAPESVNAPAPVFLRVALAPYAKPVKSAVFPEATSTVASAPAVIDAVTSRKAAFCSHDSVPPLSSKKYWHRAFLSPEVCLSTLPFNFHTPAFWRSVRLEAEFCP